jgi:hypothetical protein
MESSSLCVFFSHVLTDLSSHGHALTVIILIQRTSSMPASLNRNAKFHKHKLPMTSEKIKEAKSFDRDSLTYLHEKLLGFHEFDAREHAHGDVDLERQDDSSTSELPFRSHCSSAHLTWCRLKRSFRHMQGKF